MTSVTVFEFEAQQVRIQEINNEPWFCLVDVCKILDLTTPHKVAERLKSDGVNNIPVIDSLGREQLTAFVDEKNLYRVIFQSRKPEAQKFQDWVFDEVLPSIRKTGSYAIAKTPAEVLLECAKQLVELERRQKELEMKMALEAQKTQDLEELVHQHDSEIERIFNPNGHYFSIMGYVNYKGLPPVSLKRAAALGKKATKLCKVQGIAVEQLSDPRFGKVGTYPESILEQVF